jgi:hypothetical protein
VKPGSEHVRRANRRRPIGTNLPLLAAGVRVAGILVLLLCGLTGCSTGVISKSTSRDANNQEFAALESRIANLAREAQALESSLAIKRLQNAYGYYLEKGLWEQIVDLYTEDASIEFGNEGVYQGKSRIREYYRRLFSNEPGLGAGKLNTRFIVMPLVTVAPDGKTARGRWKDIAMQGEFGKNASWGDGIYENEFRNERGAWKMSKLHRYTIFVAPYAGGWVKAERKKDLSMGARGFPPDAPPTFEYEPFPGVLIPPFHPRLYVPENNPLVRGVMLPGGESRGDKK